MSNQNIYQRLKGYIQKIKEITDSEECSFQRKTTIKGYTHNYQYRESKQVQSSIVVILSPQECVDFNMGYSFDLYVDSKSNEKKPLSKQTCSFSFLTGYKKGVNHGQKDIITSHPFSLEESILIFQELIEGMRLVENNKDDFIEILNLTLKDKTINKEKEKTLKINQAHKTIQNILVPINESKEECDKIETEYSKSLNQLNKETEQTEEYKEYLIAIQNMEDKKSKYEKVKSKISKNIDVKEKKDLFILKTQNLIEQKIEARNKIDSVLDSLFLDKAHDGFSHYYPKY